MCYPDDLGDSRDSAPAGGWPIVTQGSGPGPVQKQSCVSGGLSSCFRHEQKLRRNASKGWIGVVGRIRGMGTNMWCLCLENAGEGRLRQVDKDEHRSD